MNKITIIDNTARQYVKELTEGLILSIEGKEYLLTEDNLRLEEISRAIEEEKTFIIKNSRELTVFNTKNLIGVGYFSD